MINGQVDASQVDRGWLTVSSQSLSNFARSFGCRTARMIERTVAGSNAAMIVNVELDVSESSAVDCVLIHCTLGGGGGMPIWT